MTFPARNSKFCSCAVNWIVIIHGFFVVSAEERGELFSSSANRIGEKQEKERGREVTADTSGRQ